LITDGNSAIKPMSRFKKVNGFTDWSEEVHRKILENVLQKDPKLLM